MISKKMMKTAAENYKSGKEVMTLLLRQREADVVITEEVVKAAAGNEESGKEVMTLLLEQRGADVVITEEMVKIIAKRFGSRSEPIIQRQAAGLIDIDAEGNIEQILNSHFIFHHAFNN